MWGPDRGLALACVKAYNDWMVDEWAGESGGRLIPLCLIPLWDPELAAAEVRRNAARGVRAVAFSELPAALNLPSIHGDHWYPFFDACEDTGTVVCMHIGSSSQVPNTSADAPKGVNIALTTVNSQLSLTDWLFSGVLVRFPRLRVAYAEAQIGWMPFVLERVDTLWRRGHKIMNFDPIIKEPPSSYARGRVYGCVFDDAFGLEVRHKIGIDQIAFETDYPHQDGTWPDSREHAERAVAPLPPDEVWKVIRGNAIDMLGLPAELPSASTASSSAS